MALARAAATSRPMSTLRMPSRLSERSRSPSGTATLSRGALLAGARRSGWVMLYPESAGDHKGVAAWQPGRWKPTLVLKGGQYLP